MVRVQCVISLSCPRSLVRPFCVQWFWALVKGPRHLYALTATRFSRWLVPLIRFSHECDPRAPSKFFYGRSFNSCYLNFRSRKSSIVSNLRGARVSLFWRLVELFFCDLRVIFFCGSVVVGNWPGETIMIFTHSRRQRFFFSTKFETVD